MKGINPDWKIVTDYKMALYRAFSKKIKEKNINISDKDKFKLINSWWNILKGIIYKKYGEGC